MKNELRRYFNYLDYLIKSKHRKGQGIHSPFVFEFISEVIFDKKTYPEYQFLDTVRGELNSAGEILPFEIIGAGSDQLKSKYNKVSDLVRISSVKPKYGKLLFRIAHYYNPSTIIELGTSIGLSALCLAKGAPKSDIATIEGNTTVCEYARSLFNKYNTGNIKAINGLFDDYLPYFEKKYPKPDLVFIDGNHTSEATLRYFDFFINKINDGFLIIDDINWSDGMRRAWKEIQHDDRAMVTIDLFFMGIIIKRKSITPGHFKVRY